MASNSGCTEVLVEGAITPNFLRKPSESVMGGSLPQVACGRQWHRLHLSLRARGSGDHPPYPQRRGGGGDGSLGRGRGLPPAAGRHARILTSYQERAMLRTGKEHLESLRDGRVVYIGSEKVEDVTRHGAFCNAAATVAALYDMKADPANRESLTYEEDGGRHSIYFLGPRTREDLQRRMLGHRRIADATFGMFGRSPDHVASFVTGMAIKPDALPAPCAHADNLLRYYRHLRDNDVYVVYAVLPPQAARN